MKTRNSSSRFSLSPTRLLTCIFLVSLFVAESEQVMADLGRITAYSSLHCASFARMMAAMCTHFNSKPECCTMFSLTDVCRLSCETGRFDAAARQKLRALIEKPKFCANIKSVGKEMCDDIADQVEACKHLQCFMTLACFGDNTVCDAETNRPKTFAAHHQTRSFDFAEMSSCSATNLIISELKDAPVCPKTDASIESIFKDDEDVEKEDVAVDGAYIVKVTHEKTTECNEDDFKYRRIDGKCNNLLEKDWGATFSRPQRYLPAEYKDGVSLPRTHGKDGKELKSARYISQYVATEKSSLIGCSTIQWAFGQYIDHDFTGFPVIKVNTNKTKCCAENLPATMKYENGGPCFPIHIDMKSEDFYEKKCIEFIRSSAYKDSREKVVVPREQMNGLSSFLDSSAVYGSTDAVNKKLKDPKTGKLKVSANNMLPKSTKKNCKIDDKSTDYCLLSGDHRVNVFVGLGMFHTMFHRYHNDLVDRLKKVNPKWDAERLYQEAKKINSAVHQHITYNEYLPTLLDENTIKKYRLKVGDFEYDPTVNPSAANVFSTAAFRCGHSQVQDFVMIGNESKPLHSTLMRPHYVITRFDDVVDGLCSSAAEKVDQHFAKSLTDRMFENKAGTKDGMDLVALNVQRGRDHGLPSYNKWREFCGLKKVTSFNDLSLFPPGNRLFKGYTSPDDVDIFIGGMAEKAIPGSQVGPTFACILGMQFRDFKFGDRFFYETKGREGFTPAQLQQIKRIRLSDIMCSYSGVKALQPNVMLMPRPVDNEPVSCTKARKLDLSKWEDAMAQN